jgi:hypothetical protein
VQHRALAPILFACFLKWSVAQGTLTCCDVSNHLFTSEFGLILVKIFHDIRDFAITAFFVEKKIQKKKKKNKKSLSFIRLP